MKKILYIGNRLSTKNSTVTSVDTLGSFLEKEGYPVRKYSNKKNKLLRLLSMCAAVFKFRKSTDIILIDTYSTQNFYYAWIVAWCANTVNIPYVPILRGGNLPERLKTDPQKCNFLFKHAKVNVSPSRYLLKFFNDFGYSNVIYIPNSIQIEYYQFKKRKITPKLLWVRSFSKIYNPLLAVKTLENLLNDYPDATLCMIGPEKDGSLEDCKTYVKNHHLPVTFTGKLEKNEWINLADEYSIFINTTNFDNTPISVIEAMALGLPVVSTNVGGIPFLLEHDKDAQLVEPENSIAFTEAVRKILHHPEMAEKLANKAREKAESFDWEKVKHYWFKLLDE